MSRQIHNSRSTKRRRFLEETEIIDVYRTSIPPTLSRNDTDVLHNQSIVSNNIVIGNESQESNLISDEFNFPSFTQCVEDNNITSNTVSDSDTDEESNHFSFFNNDEDLIIKLITKWAVTHNITNNALSALL